ncbi:MAG: putative membrane protein [uncultured Chthoniobacterales bacterium]|uniref:Putative membrane protein n=1 Tax=uncultured Chthoniobacterales bacterium TaxID=1836801 RepID=A0A6J4IYC7_9BACT|nr:MAG: putative membrane protein [uncultured Chthoniobacterales bacterium]
MFAQIARFEARYQARNPVFWGAVTTLFALTFAGMAAEDIRFASSPSVRENAPSSIAGAHIILSIIFMFIPAAFVSNVIVRDDETGFGPIIRSTRVGKFDYLIGRFTGAAAAAAIAFLAVPLAMWAGSMMPGLDPATVGPNRFSDYALAYLTLALPNIFLASAVFFALATITRSMLGTFLGVIGFLVLYSAMIGFIAKLPHLRATLSVFEPFGLAAFQDATRYWTAAESNAQMPALRGALLWNRLLWSGVAVSLLGLAFASYNFTARPKRVRSRRKGMLPEENAAAPQSLASTGTVGSQPTFGAATARAQLVARTRLDVMQVLKSPGFAVLLVLALISAITLLSTVGYRYGTPSIPVTRHMILWLSGVFQFFTLIIAIYYAGELVWRDRERKFHEILDATPLPNWAYVIPKTLAVFLVLLSTVLIGVAAAIAMQLINGYTEIELHKYLLWHLLPQSADMLLLASLAVFIQALSPNKYVGWGIMVVYLVFQSSAGDLGLEHNLYLYGNAPELEISDINGVGSHWLGALVFRVYWLAFAVLMLVAAHLLWRRGNETRLKPRLRSAPARLNGATRMIAAGALLVFVGAGAFAYYNTNVLNTYRTSAEKDRHLAESEKRFLKYEALPQPVITHVELNVALYPEETRAVTRGRFRISNLTDQPIGDVHVRNPTPELDILAVDFPGARLTSHDEAFGYRIYTLDQPIAPGDTRELSFETRRWQRGFRDSGDDLRLVANGTFLDARGIMPAIGMSRAGLLEDRAARRTHGLLPELRPAKLEDVSATARNEIGGGWATADITVSTQADQTPIAPGKKVSDLVEAGRRTARFVSDTPILTFFSIQSARYAEKHRQHAGVDLAVYYHPEHHWNVDRMLDALGAGLDYCQASFGPYQFEQLRITEFPAYAKFAQSFANTIPYSEAVGFVADVERSDGIDYVTYVTAHEAAHQWWAHQVIGAQMQGSTLLTETLAQYSALMVMKRLYGENKIRQFLKFELDRYLTGRGEEAVEELPLVRVENQPYIHYQKGSLAMYLLQQRLGEDAVNRALRAFIDRYKFKGPPYPRSVDLIELFRQQATTPEQQELITDLFERITLYDLRVQEPTAALRDDGRWDVTIPMAAQKLYATGRGEEQDATLNEEIEVGLFNAEPGTRAFAESNVIVIERRPIRSGDQVVNFVTHTKPTHVGIDPYNFYIDRNSADNVMRVP